MSVLNIKVYTQEITSVTPEFGESKMSKKVSPIPRGYRTATPCLTVDGIDSAVAFYEAAFGAKLITRHTGANESLAIHATIKIGNSIIALNQESAEQGLLSPLNGGLTTSQTHLYIDDVDSLWNRAIEAGAFVQNPLFDAYWGDRTGMLTDPNGHYWSLASKIENLSQQEIANRAQPEVPNYEEPLEALEVATAELDTILAA